MAKQRLIPQEVCWSDEDANFYDIKNNRGMGLRFYEFWRSRKDDFPKRDDKFWSPLTGGSHDH